MLFQANEHEIIMMFLYLIFSSIFYLLNGEDICTGLTTIHILNIDNFQSNRLHIKPIY